MRNLLLALSLLWALPGLAQTADPRINANTSAREYRRIQQETARKKAVQDSLSRLPPEQRPAPPAPVYSLEQQLIFNIDTLVARRDPLTGRIAHVKVVQVPGATATDLYSRARVWFINHFKSAEAVIKSDDREAGVLVGNGNTVRLLRLGSPWAEPTSVPYYFTIRIGCKEGRYRCEVTDIELGDPSLKQALEHYADPGRLRKQNGQLRVPTADRYVQGLLLARELATSLEEAMKKPAAGGGGDW